MWMCNIKPQLLSSYIPSISQHWGHMSPAISLPAKPDAYSTCVTVQGKLVSAGMSTLIIEHTNSDLIIHTQVAT